MTAPAELLDRLLVASCQMPPHLDAAKVSEVFLAVATEAFPHTSLGLQFQRSDGSTFLIVPASARPPLENLEHQRTVDIPAHQGVTLQLAADDQTHVFFDQPLEAFLQRLVMTISAALRRSRAEADLRAKHARLHEHDAKFVHTSRLASFGQIAADIVHELNSPLTSVLAYSDYLHQKAQRLGVDPADVERLGRLHEAAQRIQGFTRDLLAYARPRDAVPTAVVIHDVIEQALVFCSYVLDEYDVRVERAFGDVPAVRGLADQLTQIFVNLFTNAAHAMRNHGGRLTIQTRLLPGGSTVRVQVEDEGHGISPEHLEKIFEPYFTTKPEGMGSGLGLSIVRSIVTTHGGRIRAYARKNQGAVFELDLPTEVRPSEHPQEIEAIAG